MSGEDDGDSDGGDDGGRGGGAVCIKTMQLLQQPMPLSSFHYPSCFLILIKV